MLCQKTDFLQALEANVAAVIRKGDAQSPEEIDTRLHDLQIELLNKANNHDDYDTVAAEILRLREIRNQASVDAAVNDEHRKQISTLRDFIRAQPTTVTEFDEVLVRRLIATIVVFEDRFIVEFKSGLSIDIRA